MESHSILGVDALFFWSPFGPYSGETREQMLKRKRREIEATGWTFYSFQARKLEPWAEVIARIAPQVVYVLLSDSKKVMTPKSRVTHCRDYRWVNQDSWQSLPATISLPHPISKFAQGGSAFRVSRILMPSELPLSSIQVDWYCTSSQSWRQDIAIPSRPEYLLRPGGLLPLRSVYAILELAPPYLAKIK